MLHLSKPKPKTSASSEEPRWGQAIESALQQVSGGANVTGDDQLKLHLLKHQSGQHLDPGTRTNKKKMCCSKPVFANSVPSVASRNRGLNGGLKNRGARHQGCQKA